jgi:hypothetical protein
LGKAGLAEWGFGRDGGFRCHNRDFQSTLNRERLPEFFWTFSIQTISLKIYGGCDMPFKVRFHPAFVPEWRALALPLKERVGEVLDYLEDDGPFLGRPDVDTLQGSRHANMKEIRVTLGGEVWRFAFAFDPRQAAIILCGGAKQGMSSGLFYRRLIAKADKRFDEWLQEQNT